MKILIQLVWPSYGNPEDIYFSEYMYEYIYKEKATQTLCHEHRLQNLKEEVVIHNIWINQLSQAQTKRLQMQPKAPMSPIRNTMK